VNQFGILVEGLPSADYNALPLGFFWLENSEKSYGSPSLQNEDILFLVEI
jgi:hypothetical protein